MKVGAAEGRRCGKAFIDGTRHGLDLLRRERLQRGLVLALQGRQFRCDRLAAHPVLLHPNFQAVVQCEDSFFNGLEQLAFGLFDFLQLGFKFLGALPILAAVAVHVFAVGVDHVTDIFGRIDLVPERLHDEAFQLIDRVPSRSSAAFSSAIINRSSSSISLRISPM
ncbi:MAG: hypothetical protein GC131_08630 [Alphaproteobacteria bacterium]|nr:hypothetical protein [Alphaproteobacteria bacterium]